MPSNNPNSKPSRQSAYRRAKYAQKKPPQTFSVGVNLEALDAEIDDMEATLEANVRPAAQAGAEVLYQAVKRNVSAMGRKTGNLANSIYQAFSQDRSVQSQQGYARATYHVSWNAVKAPHGHLVEFGHMQKFAVYLGKDGKWYTNKAVPLPQPKQVAARPFIRPAMALFGEAQRAMTRRLLEGVA